MTSLPRRVWTSVLGGLNSRPFVRLVQAHALSSAGDACVAVALAGSIFFSEDPNTARSKVALSLLLTMAPFAVVAPFLGPVVDRVRGGRRFVIMGASGFRAIVCLLMAGMLDQLWLYPIAFISLVFSKTHAVAKAASVPELVKSETELVRANSILALTAVLSGFVAGGVGFGISKLGGAEWVLRIGALVFAFAAALALEVSAEPREETEEERTNDDSSLNRAGVLPAAVVMGTYRMAVGFLTFLIAFDFRRNGSPTWWFAVPISASMVGSSIGNLLAPKLRGRIREEWILTGAGVAIFLAALGVARSPGLWTSSFLALTVGASASAAKLSFDSVVQRDAPAAVHGRSFARFEAAFQVAWVLGAILPVAINIDNGVGYWFLAAACGGVALWYVITRRKQPPVTQRQPRPVIRPSRT